VVEEWQALDDVMRNCRQAGRAVAAAEDKDGNDDVMSNKKNAMLPSRWLSTWMGTAGRFGRCLTDAVGLV